MCIQKISIFMLVYLASVACKLRTFSEVDSLVSQNGQYVFTLIGERDWKGEGQVTSVQAGLVQGLRRFALRSVGIFTPKGVEQNGLIMSTADVDPKINFRRECNANGLCHFVVVNEAGTGTSCEASAPRDSVEIFLPCRVPGSSSNSVVGGIALLNRDSVANMLHGARVRPNTSFETFRTGPLYRGDDQSLLRVSEASSIRFEVDARLYANEFFRTSFNKAISYWNNAAGRELISPQITPTSSFTFGFRRSLIKYNEANGGTLARANSVADPVTGVILSMRVDTFVIPDGKPPTQSSPDFTAVLTHELGHALGMAHNFAASFDPSTSGENPTTSVMDYMTDFGDLSVPKAYDTEYMRYVYRGQNPSGRFLHCNDVQTAYLPDCTRYDFSRQTPEMLMRRLTDFSQMTSEKLASFGKDMENLMPSAKVASLMQAAMAKDPKAVGALLLGSPGLFASAAKQLSFDNSLSPELRSGLVKAVRARAAYLIMNGRGLSAQHEWWLRWLAAYAENPIFTGVNKLEFLRALTDMISEGYETPHVPDFG